MERMGLGEAKLKFEKNWIVAVNIAYGDKNKAYGDIYFITPDKSAAYEKAIEIIEIGNMGDVTVLEGVNDIRYVGGLEVCRQ